MITAAETPGRHYHYVRVTMLLPDGTQGPERSTEVYCIGPENLPE